MKKACKLRLLAAAVVSAMLAACMMAAPALASSWYTPTVNNGATVTLDTGDKAQTQTIYYRLGANSSVTYSSSNTSVAIVSGDEKGISTVVGGGLYGTYESHQTTITAVAPGSATITASDHTGVIGTYYVNVNKRIVTVPSCKSSATYTGKQIVFLSSTSGFSVEGGSATDAGTYTATATLNDPSTNQWSDGTSEPKEFTYTINRAKSDISAYANSDVLKMKANKKQYNKVYVDDASGKVTFKTSNKKVTVSKTGKVTIPKGFKGTVKVYVTDDGDENHTGRTVTVRFVVTK